MFLAFHQIFILIGRSNHIRMYFETIESKLSFIQEGEMSATVKCHEIFARRDSNNTNNNNLFQASYTYIHTYIYICI